MPGVDLGVGGADDESEEDEDDEDILLFGIGTQLLVGGIGEFG